MKAELVSTICPSNNSVPTATTSHRKAGLDVGARAGVDDDAVERSCREVRRDVHDAVDLRRLTVRASGTRLVNEHVERAADQPGPARRRDAVLALPQLEEALADQRAIDPAVERGRQRAVFGRECEEPGPVELRLVEKGQQLVVIVFGLAR